MTIRMNTTLRGMLAITVAGSMMFAAAAGNAQQAAPGGLRAPAENPNAGAVMAPQGTARAPEANPGMVTGTQYAVPAQPAPAPAPAAYAAPPQQESGGFFSRLWRSSPQQEPQQQVNTMQRRVPALNQNVSVDAEYAASAPVAEVTMTAPVLQAPAGADNIIVADELMVMDEPYAAQPVPNDGAYPRLTSVPPRPERLDALNQADARMADLQAARDQSMQQYSDLNGQMAQDMQGVVPQVQQQAETAALAAVPQPVMPQTAPQALPQELPQVGAMAQYDSELEAEFAAIVTGANAAPNTSVAVVEEYTPPVVVDTGAPAWEQAPAPVQMANAQQAEQWQPTPLVAPQTAMAAPVAPQAPVMQDQWVSLQQDPAAQMAVPVDQVSVGNAPMVASVSAIPVVPEGASMGGIQLTPPSRYGRSVRTLPESRYAARRQAVYMQRYARQSGGY